MKKILSFILVMMSVVVPVIAKESSSSSSTRRVGLEVHQTLGKATTAHRAPMRINIEAWYNAESHTIDIIYDGEAEGEVFLYLNENIIGYDSSINTSLQIPSSTGTYTIKIISETWTAQGYLML